VPVLALVVDRRAALDDALQALGVECLARRSRPPGLLGQRERGTPVAIGHAHQHRARLLVERQRPALGLLGAVSSFRIAASSSEAKVSTRARDRSAALSSKDGFSVVAPTRITVPSSITGRKESCWARLKRWISSTKSSVWRPCLRRSLAASKTFFRSATPEKIADICSKASSVSPASRRATVVLPVPGGPQKIIEPSEPDAIMRVSAPSGPVSRSWPTTSRQRARPQPVGQRAALFGPGRVSSDWNRSAIARSVDHALAQQPAVALDRELPLPGLLGGDLAQRLGGRCGSH
jgi:hypothetical protein